VGRDLKQKTPICDPGSPHFVLRLLSLVLLLVAYAGPFGGNFIPFSALGAFSTVRDPMHAKLRAGGRGQITEHRGCNVYKLWLLVFVLNSRPRCSVNVRVLAGKACEKPGDRGSRVRTYIDFRLGRPSGLPAAPARARCTVAHIPGSGRLWGRVGASAWIARGGGLGLSAWQRFLGGAPILSL